MFGQPRCREWTPLATQQLRLRSLIQIVGYNIRPPERVRVPCRFYYTLHSTPMAAPFYTSEQLASTHPKWREIDSEVTQMMSSSNVVIRIWCHMICETPTQEQMLANKNTSPQKLQDIVIETWGVYFNGFLHIGANLATDFTANSFKKNTLVFQMLGGYFCSYKSLKYETVVPNEETALQSSSSASDSSKKKSERSQHIPIEARFMQNQNYRFKESQLFSSPVNWRSDSVLSKSHSPPSNTSFRQSFAKNNNSGSLNTGLNRDRELSHKRDRASRYSERSNYDFDSNYIYEHSPSPCSDQDLKELCPSAIVLDCDNLNDLYNDEPQTDDDRLLTTNVEIDDTSKCLEQGNSEEEEKPKYRYSCLTFLKSEIRPSYKADKLRKLHLLQFLIKKKKDSVQEIKERIYQKSAIELNYDSSNESTKLTMERNVKSCVKKNLFALDKVKSDEKPQCASKNGRVSRKDGENSGFSANDRRFTLSLNELLEIKSRPSPQQRWEHARLVRQLEIVRLKRALLVEQRDAKIAHVRLLKQQHAKLFEENQDNGTELMQGYHSLSRGTCPDVRKAKKQPAAALKALTVRSQRQLQARKATMLNQLAGIFYIEQVSETYYTICGAPGLRVCGTSTPLECGKETAAKEAAGAGLAAQALIIAARILHQPLRHRIKLLGSASYIEDHLTHGLIDRDIPLFERGSPSLFQYGLFLLNGCIAQLLYSGSVAVQGGDARATLGNLKRLMTPMQEPLPLDKGLDASRTLFGSDWSIATSPLPLPPPPPSPLVPPLSHPHSLRSMVADHRGNCSVNGRQFNRFKECVDASCSLSGTKFEKKHRHSRSVGSYKEDKDPQSLEISTASMLGSEPFLSAHNNHTQITDTTDTTIAQKVIFTIGDDENSPQNWVEMSTNNSDVCELESQCSNTECNYNFKKIFTEISDFCEAERSKDECCEAECSLNTNFCDENIKCGNSTLSREFGDTSLPKSNFDDTNIPENHFDDNTRSLISKTQIINKNICESVDFEEISCENCDKVNMDGSCDEMCVNSVLQDVIVIPSAEAKIDTRDNYRRRLSSNISTSRGENSGIQNSCYSNISEDENFGMSNVKLENSASAVKTSVVCNSEIHNSNCCNNDEIKKYTIFNCEIENSDFSNTGIQNSDKIYKYKGEENSIIDYPVIKNFVIGDFKLDNSGFAVSRIENPGVCNTGVENSRIRNSPIENSVSNSEIANFRFSETENSVENSVVSDLETNNSDRSINAEII